MCSVQGPAVTGAWKRHLLIFAVSLLSDVFGLFQLDLLELHLLLVLHGPVLNDLHASVGQSKQWDQEPGPDRYNSPPEGKTCLSLKYALLKVNG